MTMRQRHPGITPRNKGRTSGVTARIWLARLHRKKGNSAESTGEMRILPSPARGAQKT